MDAKCVWFLLQRAAETVLRFELYLDKVQNLSSDRDVHLIRFFQERIGPIREDLAVHADELSRCPIEGEIDNWESLRRLLNGYALTIARINGWFHELDFLPNQPAIPSGVYIFLADLFPDELSKGRPPAVVYHRKYDFEQRSYQESLSDSTEPALPVVLRMPYVEFRNPLMWVNLVHEMGHAVDAKMKLSPQFAVTLKPTVEQREIFQSWASEFFADQVAVRAVGPAYLSAFISWYLTRYPRELKVASKTHPAPEVRVAKMQKCLADRDILGDGADFLLRTFRNLATDQEFRCPPNSPLPEVVDQMAAWAVTTTEKLASVPPFGHDEARAAKAIAVTLGDNTVVSSRSQLNAEEEAVRLQELRETLDRRSFENPGELYSVTEPLQEQPNRCCEIANAAWEYALAKGLEQFRQTFSRQDTEASKQWLDYREYLEALQRRLRKSIEYAKIHRLWQNNRAPARGRSYDGFAPHPSLQPRRREPALLTEKQILSRLCRRDPGRVIVTPILEIREQIQPSSIDLRLGTEFAIVKSARLACLDILQDKEEARAEIVRYLERVHVAPDDRFVLHPHDFALGCTLEYIKLPFDIAGRLEGKSTWGRVGLQIHSTAGFVDPGFEGALTFELQNVGRVPIPLYPAMRVAQICLYECEESSIPYLKKSHSSYGGDPGLVISKYFDLPDVGVLQRIHKASKQG